MTTRTPPTYPFLAYAIVNERKDKQAIDPHTAGQPTNLPLMHLNPAQGEDIS